MSQISVSISGNRREYAPGTSISGSATWSLEQPPAAVEISLLWYTEGIGTQDIEVIQTLACDAQGSSSSFTFTLPESPYSFEGTHISLIWAIEASARMSKMFSKPITAREVFSVSPVGLPIRLPQLPKDKTTRVRFGY